MAIIEGYFSKLFPKTFEYLMVSVSARYEYFRWRGIPDVKVKVVRKHGWSNPINRMNMKEADAYYSSFGKKIIFFADIHLKSNKANEKLLSDPLLACRYFDMNNNTRSILIHEYQHFLQYEHNLDVSSFPRIGFGRSTEKEIIVRKIKKQMRKAGLLKSINSVIKDQRDLFSSARILEKNSSFRPIFRSAAIANMRYYSNPYELDARMTEMVFNIVSGKPAAENMDPLEEPLEKNIALSNILKDTIREQKQAYKRSIGADKKEIGKRIIWLKEVLWCILRKMQLFPKLEGEAKKIAVKVKKDINR